MYPIEELSSERGLMDRLSQHFVSLLITVKMPDGKKKRANFSGFVFLANNAWYFMTAGHAIVELRDAIKNGYEITRWNLNDGFAGGGHHDVVPVDFDIDQWTVKFDPDEPSGMDIAVIHIKNLFVEALKANKVSPLPLGKDFARLVDTPFDTMGLLGIPTERVRWQDSTSKVTLGLRLIPATPIGDEEVTPELRGRFERVYARVNLRDKKGVDITSVAGTSGGALFGIWVFPESKSYDYAAVGVQSGWHEPSQQIAAWPLDAMSRLIGEHDGDVTAEQGTE